MQQRKRRCRSVIARLADQEFETVNHRSERSVLVGDDRERRQKRGLRQIALDRRHQDRNRGVQQHFLRLGAEHQSLDAAATVRRDEDEIAAKRRGRGQDRFVRSIARHHCQVAGHARRPGDHFGFGQDRPRFAGHVFVE